MEPNERKGWKSFRFEYTSQGKPIESQQEEKTIDEALGHPYENLEEGCYRATIAHADY